MRSSRKTCLLVVAPDRPESAAIEQAVAILRSGGLLVLPTDTVYGLCCDAANEKAVVRVYEAKGRAMHVPLIVFVKGVEDVEALGVSISQEGRRALEKFWPGPLTAIFCRPKHAPSGGRVPAERGSGPQGPVGAALSGRPGSPRRGSPTPSYPASLPRRGPDTTPALLSSLSSVGFPHILTGGGPTIGFRAPDHPVLQAILRESGLYLASTSANLSGQPSAKTGREAFQALRGRVDLVLDSGPAPLGRESTVVDFTASPPRIVRLGVISEQEILRVL